MPASRKGQGNEAKLLPFDAQGVEMVETQLENGLQQEPEVMDWTAQEIEKKDVVIVRCADPTGDEHSLKVDMDGDPDEYVWICKASKACKGTPPVLEGRWYKNATQSLDDPLELGAQDAADIADELDILCIYSVHDSDEFVLQDVNRKEVRLTLKHRRKQREEREQQQKAAAAAAAKVGGSGQKESGKHKAKSAEKPAAKKAKK